MKTSNICAAIALLGLASAGVHTLKVQKDSLSEQPVRPPLALVSIYTSANLSFQGDVSIGNHITALSQK